MIAGLSLLSHTNDQFTGTGLYVRELAGGLGRRERQLRMELLCNEQTVDQVHSWAGPGVRVSQASNFRIGSSRLGRAATLGLGFARPRPPGRGFTLDVDLVHYPLTLPVPPACVPTVITLHDVRHRDHPEQFSPAERAWRRVAYDRPSRTCSMVITDSDHARHRIVEHLGIDEDRVVAINLGVDRDHFRPAAPDEDGPPAELGLPRRYLFYPASLWGHKNHRRLLEALALVDEPDLVLVLSGATFGRLRELMEHAHRVGVGARVKHLGLVPDGLMPAVYRAARGLVYPSLYEGFGAPPLEAMACGVPVASSRAASLAEVCGDAALPLDPLDIEQMAESIRRMIHDEPLREDLKRRGAAQAARFDWERAVEAHLVVYRRALELGR